MSRPTAVGRGRDATSRLHQPRSGHTDSIPATSGLENQAWWCFELLTRPRRRCLGTRYQGADRLAKASGLLGEDMNILSNSNQDQAAGNIERLCQVPPENHFGQLRSPTSGRQLHLITPTSTTLPQHTRNTASSVWHCLGPSAGRPLLQKTLI